MGVVLGLVVAAVLGAFYHSSQQVAQVMVNKMAYKPVTMAVIMYHGVHSSQSHECDFVITTQAFEQDLIYLKENGYNSVVMADLIGFVYNGTPLPENPVMLTFDDGYYNNYLNAYPLLLEYDFKGVVSIIGAETEKYSSLDENSENYSHITWEQMAEMQDSGHVEFQNHSYDLHHLNGERRGSSIKYGETAEQYREVISKDLMTLQDCFERNLDYMPTTFTFPFGIMSQEIHEIIADLGFVATLGTEEKPFVCTPLELDCLWKIPRYNRSPYNSVEDILSKG